MGSAFTVPAFADFLPEHGITDITVAGIDGNCCVARTALDAVEKGYNATFPLPLIGARVKSRFDETLRQLRTAGVTIRGG